MRDGGLLFVKIRNLFGASPRGAPNQQLDPLAALAMNVLKTKKHSMSTGSTGMFPQIYFSTSCAEKFPLLSGGQVAIKSPMQMEFLREKSSINEDFPAGHL